MTVSLQELFDNGCHLGHPREKWHPRMKPWIYCERDGIHLFDLEKTAAQLEKAKARIAELKAAGKNVVVVATKKQASEMVRELTEQAEVMYVVNRCPGGLITNWEQVRRSIKRMSEIETGLAGDKYNDLTKYERMLLEKELARLERLFGGLKGLKTKPDALFVVDAQKEKNAVAEALKEKVEIIAMVDTNTDPTSIDLVIPTNDDAISAIRLVVSEALGVRTAGASVKVKAAAESTPVKTEENTDESAKTADKALEETLEKAETKVKKTAVKAKKVVKAQKAVAEEAVKEVKAKVAKTVKKAKTTKKAATKKTEEKADDSDKKE